MSDLGRIVAGERRRAGVSQRALAVRAGTSQARISRIERGLESPGFERFAVLLLALGLRAEVSVRPLSEAPAARSPRTHGERLREAASWNLLGTRLEAAGAAARAGDHPATRPRSAR